MLLALFFLLKSENKQILTRYFASSVHCLKLFRYILTRMDLKDIIVYINILLIGVVNAIRVLAIRYQMCKLSPNKIISR